MGRSLGRHALIIEDEALIAIELESLLQDLGFETFDVAISPNQALVSALRRRPDLITADMRIIGGTGLEAVGAIFAKLGPVPVVYVTGNPDLLAGQDHSCVVDKPVNAGRFAVACCRACS
jgi:CheY-like chemotaxis protein